jgi:hypothetical protein
MIGVIVDFKKWQTAFDRETSKSEEASRKAFKSAATKLYTKIVKYTPVGDPSLWGYPPAPGYTPGTLKKSWKIEFSPDEIIIHNDQPYAMRVENGWSYKQAPQGMLRVALVEYPDLLKQAVSGIKV